MGKRVLIVAEVDGFANGQKPVEIERYLRSQGHDVTMANAYYLGRASDDKNSFKRKLPALTPRKFSLWLTQLLALLTTRRSAWAKKRLSYPLVRADLRLRRQILERELQLEDFDLIIGEHPADAELTLTSKRARMLYDCMTPWADELLFEGMLTDRQHKKLRKHEARMLEAAEQVSFSWETYAPYTVRNYPISGRNLCQLNWGCTPSPRRAQFADPPRIVFLSSLSSSFINLELLSRLSKLYPIDVYGGPEPDPALGLNYLGWTKPERVLDYQIGLITISSDPLRCDGFSAKNLEYIAHGLPVMIPAWRNNMQLIRGSLSYDEANFLEIVQSLSDRETWQRVADEAYAQAQELTWDKTLAPLDGVLEDPGFRFETPWMQKDLGRDQQPPQ